MESQQFEELLQQSQVQLVNFLHSELKLGRTFAEMTAYERRTGNLEHAELGKHHVGQAIQAIRKFSDRVSNEDTREQILKECMELERTLDTL